MKVLSIIIWGGLIAAVLSLFLFGKPAPEVVCVPVDPVPVFQSMEENPPVINVTNPPDIEIRIAEQPIKIQMPVEPLEERGDALLFEADALQGMPFDQAITMPFD